MAFGLKKTENYVESYIVVSMARAQAGGGVQLAKGRSAGNTRQHSSYGGLGSEVTEVEGESGR